MAKMIAPDQAFKAKVFTGFFWKFCERFGARLIGFGVSIVLARLLTPEDYGLVALLTVFITFADLIVNSGFSNALIQKKEVDKEDFSSVFIFSTFAAVIMWMALYFAAPYIADFFRDERITDLLRVMNFRLLISGVTSVQTAYAYRQMQYRRFFYSSTAATIVSAAVAIVLVYMGYGVWALVLQSLINSFVASAILWFTVKWRPALIVSLARIKKLFGFGGKLLASSMLVQVYSELRVLMIGRLYSSADLAFYSKGRSFPGLLTDSVTTTIDSVMFPAISRKQDNPDAIKRMTRRSIVTTCYLVWPLMMGFASVARPFILLLLTEKWLPCVPYLQLTCYQCALMPIQSANTQAIKALGRSDIILYLEIIKRFIGVCILIAVMRYGPLAIAMSAVLISTIFLLCNTAPNAKLLNYSFTEQLKDILPTLGLALLMAVAVYPIQFLALPAAIILVIQVLLGAVIYILLSILFKMDSFLYIMDIVRGILKQRKEKRLSAG